MVISPRQNKALYLPLDPASVDRMAIRFRIALESIRQGRCDAVAAHCMVEIVFLTRHISEAGYGLISPTVFDDTEDALCAVFRLYQATGKWTLELLLIDQLTDVINEHERQLRETRLQIIVNATTHLNRLIETSSGDLDVFRRSPF